MALNIDPMADMIAEIEEENRRAAAAAKAAKEAAKSGGNGVGFFIQNDGERVKFRPLLNRFIPIWRHDLYNKSTGKMEVSAICAQSIALPKEMCAHCQKAETTKNKKLEAARQYIVPCWLYGIVDVTTNTLKTYKKEDGEEVVIRGVRYLQLKGGDDRMKHLMQAFKMEGDITLRDIIVTQTGSKLEKEYTIDPQPQSPFTIQVPLQDPEAIVFWIAEKNAPALLDSPVKTSGNTDPFVSSAPPAIPVAAPNKTSVPDF